MRFITAARSALDAVLTTLSPGAAVIVAVAAAATAAVWLTPDPDRAGLEMWVFARPHYQNYVPATEQWNAEHDPDVNLYLISKESLRQRMLASFLSGTPAADLIEVERNLIPQVFSGPVEDVGFIDLTDRLEAEGLFEQINEPSFSPWSTRGRVFGLPHDVHPVMLAYRADIVEAAGIDLSAVETWDQFIAAVRPLIRDADGDGYADRYAIGLWPTAPFKDHLEALILQAGEPLFDDANRPRIDTPTNAHVLATIVSWTVGPDRIATDAPEFSLMGNQARIEGRVIAAIMPDWLCGVWQSDMPQLAGKVKLMPLPAWEPGGRRTSVWGGTMLGIAKDTEDPDAAWAFAKHLYSQEEQARELYESNYIISPIKRFWDRPFYDQPSPFFSGQAPGRLYIGLAPDVPRRTSSPYNTLAKERVLNAAYLLRVHAEQTGTYDAASLEPEAQRLLAEAEALVRKTADRNVFLSEGR